MRRVLVAAWCCVSLLPLGAAEDPPKPVAKAPPAATREKLAEVTKAAEQKEKELQALKDQIRSLELAIAAEGKQAATILSPLDLFADSPKDAFPHAKQSGAIERAEARKWLKAHDVGRRVEWKRDVKDVLITGTDPFKVVLVTDQTEMPVYPLRHAEKPTHVGYSLGQPFTTGGPQSVVLVTGEGITGVVASRAGKKDIEADGVFVTVTYPQCSTDEAKRLKELKGKAVTFRASITDLAIDEGVIWDKARTEEGRCVPVLLTVTSITADGIAPEKGTEKPKPPAKPAAPPKK